MDHGSSCSHFAFFMPVVAVMCFFTVALAAKHELVCPPHTRRITAKQENLVNVSSNGSKIVNLTQTDLVWCGIDNKLPITVYMEFSEPVLVTAIVVNGRRSSYVSQFKLLYKEADKFVFYEEFKPHSSESEEFSLSPTINSTNFEFRIQEFTDLYCWHIDMHGCLSIEASSYEPSNTTTTTTTISSTPIRFYIHPTTDPGSITTTAAYNTQVPSLENDDPLQIQLNQIFIISVAGLVTSAVMICVTITAISTTFVYCTLKKKRVGDAERTSYAIGQTMNPSYGKSSNSNAVPAVIYEQVEL